MQAILFYKGGWLVFNNQEHSNKSIHTATMKDSQTTHISQQQLIGRQSFKWEKGEVVIWCDYCPTGKVIQFNAADGDRYFRVRFNESDTPNGLKMYQNLQNFYGFVSQQKKNAIDYEAKATGRFLIINDHSGYKKKSILLKMEERKYTELQVLKIKNKTLRSRNIELEEEMAELKEEKAGIEEELKGAKSTLEQLDQDNQSLKQELRQVKLRKEVIESQLVSLRKNSRLWERTLSSEEIDEERTKFRLIKKKMMCKQEQGEQVYEQKQVTAPQTKGTQAEPMENQVINLIDTSSDEETRRAEEEDRNKLQVWPELIKTIKGKSLIYFVPTTQKYAHMFTLCNNSIITKNSPASVGNLYFKPSKKLPEVIGVRVGNVSDTSIAASPEFSMTLGFGDYTAGQYSKKHKESVSQFTLKGHIKEFEMQISRKHSKVIWVSKQNGKEVVKHSQVFPKTRFVEDVLRQNYYFFLNVTPKFAKVQIQ